MYFHTMVCLMDDVIDQGAVDETSGVLHSARHRPTLVLEPQAVSEHGDAFAVTGAQLGEFVPELHSVSEVSKEICRLAGHHSLLVVLELCRNAQRHPETLLLG